MKNRFRASQAPTTAGLDQATRLRLRTSGIISIVVLVLNVALEVNAIYDARFNQVLILSILALSLALWSMLEAVSIRYFDQEHLIRQLRRALMVQVGVLAARAVLLLLGQGTGAYDADSYAKTVEGVPLGFLLVYVANFMFINQIIQNILFDSERLAAEEVKHATSIAARLQEREKILQDVHDGLGSQLLTARIRAQRTTMAQAEIINLLGDCIADLHLIVDVLKDEDLTLHAAMMDFRYRIGDRLKHDGLALIWDLNTEALPQMRQDCVLQIMRIVQEALTNAVRHSHGTEIRVQAVPSGGGVQVAISDNGTGFVPSQQVVGQGLRNMYQRAFRIGAELQIHHDNGTEVRLYVPVTSLRLDNAN